MKHLSLSELRDRHASGGEPYNEFLRVESMSAGLYVLGAGDVDLQSPHQEDEVYVVVSGRGSFTAAGKTVRVTAGAMIFVPALEEHRFHDIEERLELIVLFAPPETTSPNA